MKADGKDVGYVVVTLCHSMTFGGLTAIVDDFFIQPAFRGSGLGKSAMQELRSYCASHGIRALHVETGRDNSAALAVYRRAGFVETDHVHLTPRPGRADACTLRLSTSETFDYAGLTAVSPFVRGFRIGCWNV